MYQKNSEDIEYLKKLERMRTEFLANVSHELRTPIFAIQGYIETLLNGAIKDEKVNQQFLEKANHHTLNLNNLLNDLIDISMIETGEMRMSFRYFDISEFLAQTVSEFHQMAADKNISLSFIPPPKKMQLFGDKNKLKQAIGNLIQNALKYTEKGNVEVTVYDEDKAGKVAIK
ncbi:MAG: histidine kinase dimerization/phospho-acceptor domain-containing protein, partial [Ignavibacteriaceae bacterium]|nr:histidine kinase dimerization/phospho-acceptor domain-containing protein [Ignavibacteriaceae bacterium]